MSRREPTSRQRPIPHDSARGHVTGSACYLDDLPLREGELVVDFVGAPCAHGRLLGLDLDAAAQLPGVVGLWTASDVPGRNLWGPITADEPFLVEDEISYLGQPVAVIAAETLEQARAARRAIGVRVEELEPVLDLDTAVQRGLYLSPERRIERGDLTAGWRAARHRLEGRFESGAQEQLYFESQAALALPRERGEMTIVSSTQNPTEIQKVTAEMLGLGQHQVICKVQRMGGAFGGKETQAALPALMAALAAHSTGRPARIVYDKERDMRVTGKRHPYRCDYRVGFDDEGRIAVAELSFLSDGGAFGDLSVAVLERTILHADNAYFLPHVSIRARVCRTHHPPNTAFRGFGGPQAMAAIENIVQEIAIRLDRDALDIRRLNLYDADEGSPRAVTPYGQVVRGNLLPEILDRLEESSAYRDRVRRLEAFNREAEVELRGIAMTPVKFGISFTNKTLNQANALVHIYTDGTVQLSTGATEMGQGINTKLAQIVAEELGIPYEHVVVLETSTARNNNTSPTAASASTDLNGAAAVRACDVLKQRLADFAARLLAGDAADPIAPERMTFAEGRVFDRADPERGIRFSELAAAAHLERIDLGARGFFATPDIDFDRDTGRGQPFAYYTTGAAVAEVRIDRLLGDVRIERLDVLMDLGRRINEGIERGQVYGGLLQGIGWVTTEEVVWDERGELLSASPTTYKIPNVTDLPRELRVEFLENDSNRKNLRSTKAVGEPPLMLGISVWAAIKHALSFAAPPGKIPRLRLPATGEQIVLCLAALERDREPVPSADAYR